ncbi:MAG: ribose-phosphate diphosphokinase [Fastidiosipilaceae bacterium]|jgi:ribose-phosphate pyrophosphokinase
MVSDTFKHIDYISQNYSVYDQEGTNPMGTYGPVALIATPGSQKLVEQINRHLYNRRLRYLEDDPEWLTKFPGFMRNSFIIEANCVRFASGEGKATLASTVRGHDIYVITDFLNFSIQYNQYGNMEPMSADDHFQDLIRIILAASGKGRRLNVIMPYLYESRQSIRKARESLDCAYMLKELDALGVENIITFDPHDPRIENALPRKSVEGLPVTYQMIKTLLAKYPDIILSGRPNSAMAVSTDERGMKRAIFYSSILEIPLATFYRQRDFSLQVKGQNPILDYHFLGDSPQDRDLLVIDDMIITGSTFLETARKLKKQKSSRIFGIVTFGLFVNGIAEFNKAYEEGIFDQIFCTNLNYHTPELDSAPWFTSVDMTKYTALLIDAMNHDTSIAGLINQSGKIRSLLHKHMHNLDFMSLEDRTKARSAPID